jgi:hypothetical protein
MSGCPDIEELEALVAGSDKAEAHVQGCHACQGVLALLAGRDQAPAGDPECARIEVLVAASEIGEISTVDRRRMEEHLASCEACRELAGGEGFTGDDPVA